MIIAIVIVAIWLICGTLTYGMSLDDMTHNFPYMKHFGFSLAWGFIGGPSSFIVALFVTRRKFRFTPLTYEQRLSVFMTEYDLLGKKYFDARHR